MRSSITFSNDGAVLVRFDPENTAEARLLAALDGAGMRVSIDYEGHASYQKVRQARLLFTERIVER